MGRALGWQQGDFWQQQARFDCCCLRSSICLVCYKFSYFFSGWFLLCFKSLCNSPGAVQSGWRLSSSLTWPALMVLSFFSMDQFGANGLQIVLCIWYIHRLLHSHFNRWCYPGRLPRVDHAGTPTALTSIKWVLLLSYIAYHIGISTVMTGSEFTLYSTEQVN